MMRCGIGRYLCRSAWDHNVLVGTGTITIGPVEIE